MVSIPEFRFTDLEYVDLAPGTEIKMPASDGYRFAADVDLHSEHWEVVSVGDDGSYVVVRRLPDPPPPVDTTNRALVGAASGNVVMTLPPNSAMTPTQARVLAAWLCVVADALEPEPEVSFAEILYAVRNT